MPLKKIIIILIGLILLPVYINAQEVDKPQTEKKILLSKEIIRSPLLTQRQRIITAEVIADRYPDRSSDLLRQKAGIRVELLGGLGFESLASFRGSNSEETRLYLNGARLNLTRQGASDLDLLPVELTDEIEYIKGPASAVYGGDASGGAVNILTSEPQNTELRTVISTTWSNYSRESYRIKGGQKWHNLSYQFAASDNQVKSFSYSSNHMRKSRFNSDYKSTNGFVKLGLDVNPTTKISVSGGRFTSESGLPGVDTDGQESSYSDNRKINNTELFAIDYEQHYEALYFNVKYYGDNNLQLFGEELKNDPERVYNQGNGALINGSYCFNWGKFSLGGERNIAQYWSDVDGNYLNPTFFQTSGYYLNQDLYIKDYLKFSGSYRSDNHSRFGLAPSHRLDLRVNLATRTHLSVSNSSAYHFPRFEDVFWPLSGGREGDEDLNAAKTLMTDVGITQELGDVLKASVTYFNGETQDSIEWHNDGSVLRPQNIDLFKRGVETTTEVKLFSFLTGLVNHTWQNITYRSTGKRVVYQPAEFTDYQIKLQKNFCQDDLTWKFIYGEEIVGSRELNRENTNNLEAYRSSYAVLAMRIVSFECYIKGTNLYNEGYEAIEGYPAKEQDIRLGLNWKFKG